MPPRAGAALMEDCLAEALQQRHDGLNGVGRPSDHDGEGSVARADIAPETGASTVKAPRD